MDDLNLDDLPEIGENAVSGSDELNLDDLPEMGGNAVPTPVPKSSAATGASPAPDTPAPERSNPGNVVAMERSRPSPLAMSTTGGKEERVAHLSPTIFAKGNTLFDRTHNIEVKPGEAIAVYHKDGDGPFTGEAGQAARLMEFIGTNDDGKPVFKEADGVTSEGAFLAGKLHVRDEDFQRMMGNGGGKMDRPFWEQVRNDALADTGDAYRYTDDARGTFNAFYDYLMPFLGGSAKKEHEERTRILSDIREGRLDGYDGKNEAEKLRDAARKAKLEPWNPLESLHPGESDEDFAQRIRQEAEDELKLGAAAKGRAEQARQQTEATVGDKILKGGVESGAFWLQFAIPGSIMFKGLSSMGLGAKAVRALTTLGSAIPATIAEADKRYSENITPEYGWKMKSLDGEPEFGMVAAPDAPGEAAYKAIGGAAFDTGVEVGLEAATMGLLRLAGKPAGWLLGKATPGAVKEWGVKKFNRFMASETGQALRQINRAYQDFSGMTQINSPLGELAEENVQALEKVLNLDGKTSEYKGLQKEWNEFYDRQFNADTQWDIFYGLIAQLGLGAAKSTAEGVARHMSEADVRRDVRMSLARSGISDATMKTLTPEQQKKLDDMWRQYSADPGKLRAEVKDLGISMRLAADELLARKSSKMAEELQRNGIEPKKFVVQTDANGNLAFKNMTRFAPDGSKKSMNAMVDADGGVTIVDQGDGNFYVMNDLRGLDAIPADSFANAQAKADAEVMRNQRQERLNEIAAQRLMELMETRYAGRNVVSIPSEAALRWQVAQAVRDGKPLYGITRADQLFREDGSLRQPGAGGFHTPDGHIVVILDNVPSPAEMERVLAHEATGHEGVESATGRGAKTVEFIQNAQAEGFSRFVEGERQRAIQRRVAEGVDEATATAQVDAAMATDEYKRESMARYAQRRLHAPTWYERRKHEANERRRAAGENVPTDQADLEVMLAEQEAQGRTGDNELETLNADSGVRYEEGAEDETRNGADEAQPQQADEDAGRDGQQPPPQAAEGSVEVAPPRAEAPDAGVVKGGRTFNGHEIPSSATEDQVHALESTYGDDAKIVNISVGEDGAIRVKTALSYRGKETYREDYISRDGKLVEASQPSKSDNGGQNPNTAPEGRPVPADTIGGKPKQKPKGKRGDSLRGYSYEDYGADPDGGGTGDQMGAELLRFARDNGGLLKIPPKGTADPLADWIRAFLDGGAKKSRRGDYVALFGMKPRTGANDAMAESMPDGLKQYVENMIEREGPQAVADWFLDVRQKYSEWAANKRNAAREEKAVTKERAEEGEALESFDFDELAAARDAMDEEFANALGVVEGADEADYAALTPASLQIAKSGDTIRFDHDRKSFVFGSFDAGSGVLVVYDEDVAGMEGGKFRRAYRVTENSIEEIDDGQGNEVRADADRAGDEKGPAGGGGEAQGGGFQLESVTAEQITAEEKKRAEKEAIKKRQETPLKGSGAVNVQPEMDLGQTGQQDLFSPIVKNEETPSAAKEKAAERPAEYLAWLEKYKMKDTDRHFAEWQRKRSGRVDAKNNPVDAPKKTKATTPSKATKPPKEEALKADETMVAKNVDVSAFVKAQREAEADGDFEGDRGLADLVESLPPESAQKLISLWNESDRLDSEADKLVDEHGRLTRFNQTKFDSAESERKHSDLRARARDLSNKAHNMLLREAEANGWEQGDDAETGGVRWVKRPAQKPAKNATASAPSAEGTTTPPKATGAPQGVESAENAAQGGTKEPTNLSRANSDAESAALTSIDEIERQKRESAQKVELSDDAIAEINKWIADNPNGNFADNGLRGIFDAEMERAKARNGGKVNPADVMPTLDAISVAYDSMKNNAELPKTATARERLASVYAEWADGEALPAWADRLTDAEAKEYADLIDAALSVEGDDGGKAYRAVTGFEKRHEAASPSQTRETAPASAPKKAGTTTPPKAAKPAEGGKSASGGAPKSSAPTAPRATAKPAFKRGDRVFIKGTKDGQRVTFLKANADGTADVQVRTRGANRYAPEKVETRTVPIGDISSTGMKDTLTGEERNAYRRGVAEQTREAMRSDPALQRIDAAYRAAKTDAERAELKAQFAERVRALQDGVNFDTPGIFTGTAADYANRSRQGGVDDGPSIKKIGTGEGSQVYGWGLYGSTVRGVAETYAKNIKEGKYTEVRYKGRALDEDAESDLIAIGSAVKYVADHPKEATGVEDYYGKMIATYEDRGELYKPYAEAARRQLEIYKADPGAWKAEKPREQVYEQTFFTNRAPGDESHLLKWYEPVSEEQKHWIKTQAEKEGIIVSGLVRNLRDGGYLYERLTSIEYLGSPKAASEFLYRAGIDGVKYPVDSYGGKSVKDGDKAGWNYVAFSDEHIRVDHKWTDGVLQFDTPELSADYSSVPERLDHSLWWISTHDEQMRNDIAALRKVAERNIKAGADDTPSEADARDLKRRINEANANAREQKRLAEEDPPNVDSYKKRETYYREEAKELRNQLKELKRNGIGEDREEIDWYTNGDLLEILDSIESGEASSSMYFDPYAIGRGEAGPFAEALKNLAEFEIFKGKDLERFNRVAQKINDAYKAIERDIEDPRGPYGEFLSFDTPELSPVTPAEDAAYMDAVRRGDMETAGRMVREAADRAGYGKIGFHGTTYKRGKFTTFQKGSHIGSEVYQALNRIGVETDGPMAKEQINLIIDDLRRSGKDVLSLRVKLDNPLRISDFGDDWSGEDFVRRLHNEHPELFTNAEWAKMMKDPSRAHQMIEGKGYDGLVYDNGSEGILDYSGDTPGRYKADGTYIPNDSYIPFHPSQIKSVDPVTYDDAGNVIPLSQRFNQQREDIRFDTPELDPDTETAYREWLGKYRLKDTPDRRREWEGKRPSARRQETGGRTEGESLFDGYLDELLGIAGATPQNPLGQVVPPPEGSVAQSIDAEIAADEARAARGAARAQGAPPAPAPGSQGNKRLDPGYEPESLGAGVKDTVSRQEIVDKFRELFSDTVAIRGKNTTRIGKYAGHYEPGAGIIRSKDPVSLRTIPHELGHHIDAVLKKHGPMRPNAVKAELIALGKKLYGGKQPAGGYQSEGFAEMVKYYLQGNEEGLKKEAPAVYSWLVNDFGKAHPDIMEKMDALRDMIDRFQNQSGDEAVRAIRAKDPNLAERIVGRLADMVKGLKLTQENWLDTGAFITKGMRASGLDKLMDWRAALKRGDVAEMNDIIENHPVLKWKLYNGKSAARAYQALAGGLTDLSGTRRYTYGDLGMATPGHAADEKLPMFKEIFGGFTPEEMDEFENYAIARIAKEAYLDKGLEFGLTKSEIAPTLAKHARNTKFRDALERYTHYKHGVLHLLVDAGAMSQEQFEEIVKANPIYVKIARRRESADLFRDRMLKKRSKAVNRRTGSGRQVEDIFDAGLVDDERVFSAAFQADLLRSLVNLGKRGEANNAAPGGALQGELSVGANWIHEVPNAQGAVRFAAEQLRKQITDAMRGAAMAPDKAAADNLFDQLFGDGKDILTVFKQKPSEGKNGLVSLYDEDGALHTYELPENNAEGWAKGLMGFTDSKKPNILEQWAQIAAAATRTGATILNPTFALRNIVRDTLHASTVNEFGFMIPGASTVQGIAMDMMGSNAKEIFDAMGIPMGSMLGESRLQSARRANRYLMSRNWFEAQWNKGVKKAIADFVGFSENGTRIKEFKLVRDYMLSHGASEKAADMLAGANALDITIDFQRGGEVAKSINRFIPFFNAGIQGLEQTARAFGLLRAKEWQLETDRKKRAGRTVLQGAAWLLMLSLLAELFNRSDDDRKKKIDELKPHERWNYISFGDVRLPVPYEIGYIFSSIPRAVIAELYDGQKGAVAECLGMFRQTLPGISPTDIAFVGPALNTAMNEYWHGGTIVPEYVQKSKLSYDWYDERTSEFSKMLGKAMYKMFGQGKFSSPAHIDAFMNGITGNMYGRTLGAIGGQAELDASRPNTWPVVGTFFRNNLTANRLVGEFYERKIELEREKGSGVATEGELAELHNAGKLAKRFAELRKESQKAKEDKSLSVTERNDRLEKIVLEMQQSVRDYNNNPSGGDETAYEIEVKAFEKANGEYKKAMKDKSVPRAEWEKRLSGIREGNPLMRDDVRGKISAYIKGLRAMESTQKKAQKAGRPTDELDARIAQRKAEILDMIRAARR